MRILILSKTQMHGSLCVGGISLNDMRPVRLLQSNGSYQPLNTPYQIGQVWELTFQPEQNPIPPHIEGVCVQQGGTFVQDQDNLKDFLIANALIWRGAPAKMFGGLLRATGNGAGYISQAGGVSDRSTGFWISDKDVTFNQDDGKSRYLYSQLSGISRIPYVGTEAPIGTIPAGTLIRVSLARWWPEDDPSREQRCYLQLSGWYS
jgi:hypothetical protein